MGYLAELRWNWRALTAATLGLAVGYTLNNYITNIFLPHLLKEFGWSKADFALLGVSVLIAAVTQPIAGRLTDAIGVRRVALLGVLGSPLFFIAYSRMSGDFHLYAALYIAQIVVVGGTTSVVIYSRLIAQTFDAARGLALGIAAAAPSIAGGLGAPLLSGFVDAHGWRAGYLAVAAASAVIGLGALALVPKEADRPLAKTEGPAREGVDYPTLLRDPAFLLLIGAMLLCNLTLTLQMSQIKVVTEEAGIGSAAGSLILTLYAVGVIAGRLICGAALDRYPAHLVGAICLALPAIGLFVLASGTPSAALIAAAVAILGLSLGAEGDVGAYLVMRYFPTGIFSSVMGLVLAAYSLSGAAGAVLLSLTLSGTGQFAPFLVASGVAAVAGGLLLLLLPRTRRSTASPLIPAKAGTQAEVRD
jgi:MFS family permease